ncbi:ABC transporter permease [uncultured Clostridium sp.]|uniref:ABC transporter permease n=1 Tax=uncultured Clostridium sp. TaxID=59620 RepID=UPI00259B2BD0|nr:ABC transporter permease [uncultured Clostridium sp.]
MIKNAFAYVTRKSLKSVIILLVVLAMSALSLISLSIKDATNRASEETFGNITSSFSMEINRQVNPGTPRGGGNVKGEDIKKISENKNIYSYVKRINSVADLIDHDIVETKETLANQSPERSKNFKRTVMLTGVNESSKENKFVSGAYKLIEGKHLENQDKNKVLMHKDLAKKNNLKVGDKIKIKSNLFDADNEKGANETVEVEIKGLFDGHNNGVVSVPQELYENTLITDINTAAKVYGNTEDTAAYQDATFFVKGDKNLEKVIKDIGKLDINWREYNLIKSSSNYPALQQSISGLYSIANKLFAGSLIFAGVVVSLLLFLWINARKKEIAVLLSLGISKLTIFGQFLIELIFISIPAFIGSYFLASYTGNKLGNNILNRVTGDIAKKIAKQSLSSQQLGGGAEVDGFNKTLTSLDINILPKSMVYVILFMSLVLIISLIISSYSILKKNPKELLIDND